MNLYELARSYAELQEMDVDEQTFLDTLDSIQDTAEVKVENCAYWTRNLIGENAAIKQEEDRLKKRRKANENKVKWLNKYVQDFLDISGLTKFKAGIFTLSIQNNPPSLEIYDATLIPEQYLKPQAPVYDTQTIKDLLKQGEEIPGATLKQTKGLRIR